MHALVLLCINQPTTFEVPTFTDSEDMIGANIKNGSRVPKKPYPLGGSLSSQG